MNVSVNKTQDDMVELVIISGKRRYVITMTAEQGIEIGKFSGKIRAIRELKRAESES